MSSYQNNPALSQLTLGKTTAYHEHYDASLLQAVPRSMNREPLGLYPDALPFHGADIWTLYEISWLNAKGLPQVAVGEISLQAQSLNLIESKSFKLYLNSFNQTHFDDWESVRSVMERDLSHCAQGEVTVTLRKISDVEGTAIGHFTGECIDEQDIEITRYSFNTDYLHQATGPEKVTETLVSHLLKSNCLITNQPDWGSVQIEYTGSQINREALLRYLVSFRQHNEFHEQCVERIFNDLLRFCQPEKLAVYARYTRRGGLDINPWRANFEFVPARARLVRQ